MNNREAQTWFRPVYSDQDLSAECPGQDPELSLRRRYRAQLRDGLERFFLAAQSSCPLCDGRQLEPFLEVPDLFQYKPGTFHLDRCGGCGHIFQNPQLSPAGLDFYYGDFYSGMGERKIRAEFGRMRRTYLSRAETLRGHTEPEAWLDVGAGQGHFCYVARKLWRHTRFDALDQSEALLRAAEKEWVDNAYVGRLLDLTAELEGEYDVISMFQYLEHTPEPWLELEAAAEILPEGGYLLVEVPDPTGPLQHVFGRYWNIWMQPQHLHFFSQRNLESLLEKKGFTVLQSSAREARLPREVLNSLQLYLRHLAPPENLPWQLLSATNPGRAMAFEGLVVLPSLLLSRAVDGAVGLLARRLGWSNSFRILARRR